MDYTVDLAGSNKTSCKTCSCLIKKDDIRLNVLIYKGYNVYPRYQYYCSKCGLSFLQKEEMEIKNEITKMM